MLISVIVCTCNRAQSLRDTLEALLNQKTNNNFDYEIVLVDNNSKDDTGKVTQEYQYRSQRFKYVFEPKQGLSYARNHGIREARGELIVFTDDDCIPEPDWLLKIAEFLAQNPDLDGFLGGAKWEDGRSMYPQDNNILRGNGLNMAFRKTLFKKVGLFEEFLGAGSLGFSAEDAEFIYRVTRAGGKIIVHDAITIIHKHRIGTNEQLKIYYRDMIGLTIFRLKYLLYHGEFRMLKEIIRSIQYNMTMLLSNVKDEQKRLEKKARLKGTLIGIARGFCIWWLLVPCRKITTRAEK